MSPELETRVKQFRAFELPGQPMIAHMGTVYLVNDLVKEVRRLELALAHLMSQGAEDKRDGS